jgi:hypothetical protein
MTELLQQQDFILKDLPILDSPKYTSEPTSPHQKSKSIQPKVFPESEPKSGETSTDAISESDIQQNLDGLSEACSQPQNLPISSNTSPPVTGKALDILIEKDGPKSGEKITEASLESDFQKFFDSLSKANNQPQDPQIFSSANPPVTDKGPDTLNDNCVTANSNYLLPIEELEEVSKEKITDKSASAGFQYSEEVPRAPSKSPQPQEKTFPCQPIPTTVIYIDHDENTPTDFQIPKSCLSMSSASGAANCEDFWVRFRAED